MNRARELATSSDNLSRVTVKARVTGLCIDAHVFTTITARNENEVGKTCCANFYQRNEDVEMQASLVANGVSIVVQLNALRSVLGRIADVAPLFGPRLRTLKRVLTNFFLTLLFFLLPHGRSFVFMKKLFLRFQWKCDRNIPKHWDDTFIKIILVGWRQDYGLLHLSETWKMPSEFIRFRIFLGNSVFSLCMTFVLCSIRKFWVIGLRLFQK